ncbi:MAG TPA: pectate lyase [Pirellulales bacterium]
MANCFARGANRVALSVVIIFSGSLVGRGDEIAFPGATWEAKDPRELGLDPARLDAVAAALGSRGCAIKNGYVVKTWGAQDQRSDWFSSAKPVLSTLLMFALQEGKITSFDQPVADFDWELSPKDRAMTLRQLASMTSGYARPEEPGKAWAYNDYAIQLYQLTVFDKIFNGPAADVFHEEHRFGALGLQDGFTFNKKRRMSASVRDFARVAWFWLNRGRWNDAQVLPRAYFDDNMRPQVPPDLPVSQEAKTNDYLNIGSYGGESSHFSKSGPGIYGFNWWFNDHGQQQGPALTWPDAPQDTVMSVGHRGNCSVLLPGLNFVVVASEADWGPLDPGKADSVLNKRLKLITAAGTPVTAEVFTPKVEATHVTWQPMTITLDGPTAAATDSAPNPFKDIRLQVVFTGPDNKRYDVPGFFDGDGRGGPQGNVWRVRFTPDAPGKWTYQGEFRGGPNVAIDIRPDAGQQLALPNLNGTFDVAPRDPNAAGFSKWGRLRYADNFYLKFADGPYWIRGGTDEPEDLLGYQDFDNTPGKHKYAAHVEDWCAGDPEWGEGRGHGLVGALNYLAKQHVNSIYFLTMNIGGDGKDVWPWIGPINSKGSPDNDNLHYDVGKLAQWEIVFAHAQRLGIFLHIVFNEAEEANKRELDDGELGLERKLYYREMIARFGHHLALEWNLCEEYNLQFDFGPERIREFADYVRAIDPYDHPITVHSAGDPVEKLRFTFGDPRFSLTSVQLNHRPIHEVTEALRSETKRAGRPLPISLDEFTLDRGQRASHIPVDDAEGHRREKIWPTYFSGGMIEFILDDLLRTDSFKTPEREKLWKYLWNARHFMEENLPFWEMEPADQLSADAATFAVGVGKGKTVPLGPQVFGKRGAVYAVYLPTCTATGTLDLTDLKGTATQRWFHPARGEFVGPVAQVTGGARRELGPPPADPDADWVVLIEGTKASEPAEIDVRGFRDGAHHWRKIRDNSRVIQALPDQPTYAPSQVAEIVGNILVFQRENGGWPKDYDYLAVLTPEQIAAIGATRDRTDTSFDNYNIHTQVDYLAQAYTLVGDESWRDACLRGFDFMLRTQLANGGFPQRYPDPTGYAAHITFNDGVTIGILNVLKDAADGLPHWSWLDAIRRQSARDAVARGTACILKCQIQADGTRTGWCQQHDETTFAAATARTFELASCCPQETTAIVRFLIRIEQPDSQIVQAVDAAVEWLDRAKLSGIRVQRVAAPVEEFDRHSADFDTVVVSDESAPPIWARHYEIGTDRPVFAGRDAVKRYNLSEIERERRTGTPWYGEWPRRLLASEYGRWHNKLPGQPTPPKTN